MPVSRSNSVVVADVARQNLSSFIFPGYNSTHTVNTSPTSVPTHYLVHMYTAHSNRKTLKCHL